MQRAIFTFSALGIILLICCYFIIGAYLSVRRTVSSIRFVAEQVRQGNLDQRCELSGKDELAEIATGFNDTLSALRDLLSEVQRGSTQMLHVAENIANTSSDVRNAITEQQSQTQLVATAVSQMTATGASMAGDATQGAESTLVSQQAVSRGQTVVGETIAIMAEVSEEVASTSDMLSKLQENSDEIGGVIDVIRNIAEQTNLLALNAAIEAARAGEQGRGFAVVADEVRTLASRTQASTDEIQQMIEAVQQGTLSSVNAMTSATERAQQGVEQAEDARAALDEITRLVDEVVGINTNIASAIEEQSHVMSAVEQNVVQISDGANDALGVAEDANQASQEIRQQVEVLEGLVKQYRL